jgi:hypothetical protein
MISFYEIEIFYKDKLYNIINFMNNKLRAYWGLGIGDWPIPNPQSPIPNPQSPLDNLKRKF